MINIKKEYQIELLQYFNKKNYSTNEILKESDYSTIHLETKDFLENLSFEKNGFLSNDILCSDYEKNSELLEIFFKSLTAKFGQNSRDTFIETNEKTVCDISKNCNDEKVKTIKKCILKKYSNMYKNFRTTHGKRVIEETDINICPYCYRSYINVIEAEKGSKVITPDLDHFYPKSRYPFLAVTLSNLVPSCLFCNQRAKNDEDFYKASIYPPQKIFDEIEFDYDVYLNKIYIKNYKYLISKPKYKMHLDTFLIQELYSGHTEILKNIIDKNRKYRKSKIEDITKHTVGLSSFDVKKIVFYEYEFMNKKRELLYKLKKDLYKDIVK